MAGCFDRAAPFCSCRGLAVVARDGSQSKEAAKKTCLSRNVAGQFDLSPIAEPFAPMPFQM
jgi:hypothetical protein